MIRRIYHNLVLACDVRGGKRRRQHLEKRRRFRTKRLPSVESFNQTLSNQKKAYYIASFTYSEDNYEGLRLKKGILLI